MPYVLSLVFRDCNATLFGQKPLNVGLFLRPNFFLFILRHEFILFHFKARLMVKTEPHLNDAYVCVLLVTLSTEFARTALQIKQLGKHFPTSSEKSETENCF